MKLKKGDSVIVIAGKHKGQTGTISKTLGNTNQIIIEGVNVSKRHQKQTQTNQASGVFEITRPIDASNVAIVHPTKKNASSRIGMKIDQKTGKKTRVYRQAGNKEIK